MSALAARCCDVQLLALGMGSSCFGRSCSEAAAVKRGRGGRLWPPSDITSAPGDGAVFAFWLLALPGATLAIATAAGGAQKTQGRHPLAAKLANHGECSGGIALHGDPRHVATSQHTRGGRYGAYTG